MRLRLLISLSCLLLVAWQKAGAQLAPADQRDFVNLMRQNKVEGWTGRPGALVYAVSRADAVDVVYGTMEGYDALGIPYMPHIPPQMRW